MGYHKKKKKKLYRMGGEMEKYMMGGRMEEYKKGGKMPKFILELFKKKNKKKSMEYGGGMHGGKPTIRETDKEPIQFKSVDPNRERGEKKNRMGMVVRYDSEGRPYHVKKGLFNETEYMQHSDGTYSPTVKNRTPLGKFFTGSDAKASLGGGGKMGKMYSFKHGGKHPEDDDIPALDPNADFLKKDRYVEEPGIGFQDGFFIEGDGPIIKGLTLGSETLQSTGGEKPQLATMYLGGGEGKMKREIEDIPRETPDPEGPEDVKPLTPRRPRLEAPERELQKSSFSVPKPMDIVTRQYKLAPSMKTGQMPSAGRGDVVEKPGMVAGRMVMGAGDSFVRPIPEEEIADYKFANQIVSSGDYLRNKQRGSGSRDKVLYPDYDAALLSELSPRLFQEYRRKYGSAPKPGQALEFLRQVEGYEGYEGSKRSDLGPGPVAYDRYTRGGKKVSPGYEERAATIKRGGGGKLYHFGG